MAAIIRQVRLAVQAGDKDKVATLKRKLPLFIFMAGGIDESTNAKGVTDTWRKQEHTHLNGLVMIDFDHVENPLEKGREIYSRYAERRCILLCHVTPSGQGLRFVVKASKTEGNLADNARGYARRFGLTLDEACKDASRGSFACTTEDIIYLDPELFNYDDKNYDDQFGQDYRKGRSAATHGSAVRSKTQPQTAAQDGAQGEPSAPRSELAIQEALTPDEEEEARKHLQFDENDNPVFNGVPFTKICEEYWKEEGGAPAVGTRHVAVLSMANRLRYIADNNPSALLRVIDHCGLPTEEVRQICDSACAYKMAPYQPPRLRAILKAVGADTKPAAARGADNGGKQQADTVDYEAYWQRLRPLLSGALADACQPLPEHIRLGGVLAAGAMFGTYLTRTWWRHYDGEARRLSFLCYIIGNAASGKSFTLKMDKLIMEPMRSADNAGREWERKYKEDKAKRATSSAAQKKQAEDIKHPVIRYIPSTISNAMLYQRLADAVETVGGEPLHLHLYTCEAELATALRVQQGSWAGKLDLECKSFQNEYAGVDYKNEQSVNGIFQVNWNQVISGTPDAMQRKIKPATVLDGLVTRLALFVMPESNFTMIAHKRQASDHEAEVRLRTWGHKLERLWGELKCEKLVDAAYDWCDQRAREAAMENDTVADYFRKRVPMYIVRYGIVYNVLRDYDYIIKQDPAKGIKLRINTQDLKFALLMGDFIYDMQIRQYGEMVRTALENQTRDFVPRQRQTRNAEAFDKLPQKFSIKDVQTVMGLSYTTASVFLSRAVKSGFVKRTKQGQYEKLKSMST